MEDSDGDSGSKKSPDKWKSDIKKAAKAMGVKISDKDVDGIASLIKNESGGDPKIQQQIQDQNSGGNEAQGLLQYVPSTFKNYAVKGHDNIHSGYDQLLAFFNNKNWQRDYNPNGGWSPTGGRVKGRGGGYGAGYNMDNLSSTISNNLAIPQWDSNIPNTTIGDLGNSQNQSQSSSTTNNNDNRTFNVSVNVKGTNESTTVANMATTKIEKLLGSPDQFSNQYLRK